MRILLFGKYGQLGYELNRCLRPLGEVVAFDQEDLDLTESNQIPSLIREVQPTIIINAAAYTAVDRAEEEESLAYAMNAAAPGVMAEVANKLNAVLIHYSTDYVFDGAKGEPYIEDDSPNPINVYGRSKLEGEHAVQDVGASHIILRTSWLYSMRGPSFPNKVLRWAREQDVLRIVDDQIGSPTWARMLAEATAFLLAVGKSFDKVWLEERTGIYHLAGLGSANRFEWAAQILKNDPRSAEHVYRDLQRASSSEFPNQAQRPSFSALRCDKFASAFKLQIPPWEESLELAMGGDIRAF
ncbi:MAG: dTDP-4-dehydrorhamnose reductase [Anaerolineales bacterium]|nr:dTDP-4-dehydrorhamnose reductase [Anaerolineales bacterium]